MTPRTPAHCASDHGEVRLRLANALHARRRVQRAVVVVDAEVEECRCNLGEKLLRARLAGEALAQLADVASAHGIGVVSVDGRKDVEHAPVVTLRLRLEAQELVAGAVVADHRGDAALADAARLADSCRSVPSSSRYRALNSGIAWLARQTPALAVASEVQVDRALSPDRLHVAGKIGPHESSAMIGSWS